MKKIFSLILATLMMLSLATTVSAENYDKVFTYDGNEIMVLSDIAYDE